MACQALKNELAILCSDRADLQQQLSTAATGAKSELVAAIKELNKQIAAKEHELDVCLSEHPDPEPLTSIFGGTYTLLINHPAVPGPISGPIQAGAVFNGYRSQVKITSMSELGATFPTPFGQNTTTVTLNPHSPLFQKWFDFDKTMGAIAIALPLNFDHSIVFAGDSTLDMPLGTGSMGSQQGSPLNAAGEVTLVGSAVFVDGYLGNSRADLTVVGKFEPIP
jgi:hypothetical protein